MAALIDYIKESYGELRSNVSWTPRAEAQRLTIVVVVFTVLFSLAIWGVDYVFSGVVSRYFELVKK